VAIDSKIVNALPDATGNGWFEITNRRPCACKHFIDLHSAYHSFVTNTADSLSSFVSDREHVDLHAFSAAQLKSFTARRGV